MKALKMYPPGGKGTPIVVNPAKIDEMKEKGWVENSYQKPKQVKEEK